MQPKLDESWRRSISSSPSNLTIHQSELVLQRQVQISNTFSNGPNPRPIPMVGQSEWSNRNQGLAPLCRQLKRNPTLHRSCTYAEVVRRAVWWRLADLMVIAVELVKGATTVNNSDSLATEANIHGNRAMEGGRGRGVGHRDGNFDARSRSRRATIRAMGAQVANELHRLALLHLMRGPTPTSKRVLPRIHRQQISTRLHNLQVSLLLLLLLLLLQQHSLSVPSKLG